MSPIALFARMMLRSRLRVPRNATGRLPHRVRDTVWSMAAAFFVLATAALVVLAATGSRLGELPDSEALVDVFFRATFVPLMFLIIAGFIASLRIDPTRIREHMLLRSLPLSVRDTHRLFVISSLYRSIWLPLGVMLLLATLAAVAPTPFVVRLNVITLAAYLGLHLLCVMLHLAVSLRGAGGQRLAFPAKPRSWIYLAMMVTYAIVPVAAILYPNAISEGFFWIVLGVFLVLATSLFFLSEVAFARWYREALVLKARNAPERPSRFSYRTWRTVMGVMPGEANPLLIKNVIRSSREGSLSSGIILGLLFIAVAFLVAMNNDRLDDAVTMLLGTYSVYAFFVVARAMNRLGADEEPPSLVYSMPLTRTQLYLSVFVPLVVSLLAMAATLAFMVILVGGGVQLALRFVTTSVVMLLLFGSMGIGIAVAEYPRGKDAINRFLGWTLVVAICVVVLYPYRSVVVLVAMGMSLLPLRKRGFFRT